MPRHRRGHRARRRPGTRPNSPGTARGAASGRATAREAGGTPTVGRCSCRPDIAMHEVCVPRQQRVRAEHVRGQDAVAKAGREPLDLRLHGLHEALGCQPFAQRRGSVGVGPRGVSSRGCPGRLGNALLSEQQKRSVRKPVTGFVKSAARAHLIAADVDGSGAARVRRRPRDRTVEGPVELDRGRTLSVADGQPAVPAVRASPHSVKSACGITSASTSKAGSSSPPATPTPRTRPAAVITRSTRAPVG